MCARQTGESGGYIPELHSNTIYIIYMIYNVPSAPKIKTCTLEYPMCGNTRQVHDSATPCGCAERWECPMAIGLNSQNSRANLWTARGC